MTRVELGGDEKAVLRKLAEEARPHLRRDRPTRPDELPDQLGTRTFEAWNRIAAAHGLDPSKCRFQVDPDSQAAWIIFDPCGGAHQKVSHDLRDKTG